MINRRKLGRTDLEVSEVGYGAWGIGGSQWLGAEDQESLAALHRAIDRGVTFIDTALAYGRGHSEQLVGRVVAERDGVVDTVQVIYNVFDQSPEDELLAVCEREGIGVIARVPFDEGSLAGAVTTDTTFPDGDFRNAYFGEPGSDRRREVHDRVEALLADLAIERPELAEVALRYVLSHPGVSTAIPGMRTPRNVDRNAAAGDGEGLPEETVERLKAHRWDRNLYV